MNKWSATTGTFIIILSLSVSLCAKTGQQSGKTNQQRINDWIRTECEKDPRLQRLNTQADAFGRMLRLRAAHELGISISDLYGIDESSPLSQPSDTGVATNVSKSKFTQQNETTIAIDRALPNIIVAGANDDNMYVNGMPIYSSTNTGKSWSRLYVKAPKSSSGTWVAIGDPVLEAGPDSTLYYAYLWGDPYSQSFPDNLVVATSINGRIWRNGTPVLSDDMIDGFEDKESMCIDNSPMSPHYGRVYIAWVHFDWSGSGETRIAYSDDKCKTWSLPTVIESAPEQFGSVKTGANGEVFVAYSSGAADSLGNPVGIHLLYVSTDGAETFEPR